MIALVVFLAIVGAVIWVIISSGFWPEIFSYLIDPEGIAGLTPDFAIGLATEATSIAFQTFIAVVIFGWIAGYREWRIRRDSGRLLAKGLADLFAKYIDGIKGTGPMRGYNSAYRTQLYNDYLRTFFRYVSVTDGRTETLISDAHAKFEEFVFRPEEGVTVDYVECANNVISNLKTAFILLGLGKKRRKRLLEPLREKMISLERRLELPDGTLQTVTTRYDGADV